MLGIEIMKRLGSGSGSGSGTLQDTSITGTTYAQWTIGSDGFTYKRFNSGASHKSTSWINPQSGMNLYEVRATLSSGDVPDGTTDVWLNLGTSQTWGWTNELFAKTCDLLIEVRRASDGVVISSATVTLTIVGLE